MKGEELTREEMLLVDAEAALRWAANGSFSARITPEMARALLGKLERADFPLTYLTVDPISTPFEIVGGTNGAADIDGHPA